MAVTERDAVRAIVLSDCRHVLLLRIHGPDNDEHFWWITPGGGREGDEDAESCLRRELREELGLDGFEIGPVVWRRQHTFDWGERRICQRESYHVVHVERFEPQMSDPHEATWLDRFHWWPVSELHQADEPLTPLSLADIVHRYLSEGAPVPVPDMEVLVD